MNGAEQKDVELIKKAIQDGVQVLCTFSAALFEGNLNAGMRPLPWLLCLLPDMSRISDSPGQLSEGEVWISFGKV